MRWIQYAGGIAALVFAAGASWALLGSRVSAAEATIETHTTAIHRLDVQTNRTDWNLYLICTRLAVPDCERPPERP